MSDHALLRYCPDLLAYNRRKTREVMVGKVGIGGGHPIRVQSMITSDTRDTPACVAEVLQLAEAGCEIVRITAQTKVYAANLENIAREVRAAGCQVPLVADIHFKPDAALEAARWVEKVRVNPGNYVDKKKFAVREYSDAEYAEEVAKIREEFIPLVELCKSLGRAMRIGTNHGSLSDRIMNYYGDSPLGMVESALEFARIAREFDYHNFVFSMKASNPKVMIEAYRLLVARLDREGPDWNYPIHLGVTEAGDGEDGRIKSAIGIGSLLADGIGDTIRVSLTEDAIHEIPVAQALALPFQTKPDQPPGPALSPSYDPFSYERRRSSAMEIMGHALGGVNAVRVFTAQEKWNAVAHKIEKMGDFKPEIIVEKSGVVEIDPRDEAALTALNHGAEVHLVTVKDGLDLDVIPAFRMLACRLDARHPILLKDVLQKSGCGVSPQASLAKDAVATFIRPDREIDRTKGTYLPHWTQDGGVYAINFRLADSLPQTALNDYLRERTELEQMLADEKARMKSGEDSSILSSLAHKLSNLYESTIGGHLDAGHGECQLRDERIASVIVGTLRHFDGDRYRLLAWCVMANHVHLVIQPLGEHLLGDILQSIKSYTAKAANTLLSRSGTFWQRESYDHLIRDGEDYRNQIRYVLENPEKAGLRDWPWRGSVYGATWESVAASQEKDGEGLRRDATATLLTASRHLGSLLCDGIGDAILVQGEPAPGQSLRLSYNVLQAAGTRIFKTDYVACPSCGRTLFNLQSTTQKIRASTGHLKGVRIAVMGCIVNGPGEMADADFGYVGGAPGKINLYVGKQPVKFNIPEDEAVERLIDLIREHGKWIDAPAGEPVEV
jgi:(E)-4-hydroxy-3-methylbut-2-enyl-diphosphate synthase